MRVYWRRRRRRRRHLRCDLYRRRRRRKSEYMNTSLALLGRIAAGLISISVANAVAGDIAVDILVVASIIIRHQH